MKPNCICSFSGSDKAPSELLHFYVGVDRVWKLFLGPFFSPLFFFLNHHKYAMLPLSSANCCHHPLKFYFLCWFHFCREAHHSEHAIPFPKGSRALDAALLHPLVPRTERTGLPLTCLLASSSCWVAFCSSERRDSAWLAVSSCSSLAVSTSRCLWGERTQTTARQ